MFEIARGQQAPNIDGAGDAELERAGKRVRLTEGDGKLEEIAMEESPAILDKAIPYFYVEDELDLDTDNLPQLSDEGAVEGLEDMAKFFDKFEMLSGKAALSVNLA